MLPANRLRCYFHVVTRLPGARSQTCALRTLHCPCPCINRHTWLKLLYGPCIEAFERSRNAALQWHRLWQRVRPTWCVCTTPTGVLLHPLCVLTCELLNMVRVQLLGTSRRCPLDRTLLPKDNVSDYPPNYSLISLLAASSTSSNGAYLRGLCPMTFCHLSPWALKVQFQWSACVPAAAGNMLAWEKTYCSCASVCIVDS